MADKEIQVGEYVRTKDGNIGKIEQINKEPTDDNVIYIVADEWVGMYEEIVKHSPNIIDLIEAGDYVNGCLVEAIDYEEDEETGGYHNVLGIWEREDDYCYGIELSKLPIRTIVTKEQMEAMQYVI